MIDTQQQYINLNIRGEISIIVVQAHSGRYYIKVQIYTYNISLVITCAIVNTIIIINLLSYKQIIQLVTKHTINIQRNTTLRGWSVCPRVRCPQFH
jgi:membrane protein YdbS with pleckstrin-like domain